MVRTIWKSTLRITGVQNIRMPKGSEIRCIGEQHGELCIWFECDPDEPVVEQRFYIFGTGHPVQSHEDIFWRATVPMSDGLVWHVYSTLFTSYRH